MASDFAKQILYPAKNSGKTFGIDFHADLYQGCPHGCLFCEYAVLGNDFGTVTHKTNVIEVLSKELTAKPAHAVISLGSAADPYPSIEAEKKLTRQALTAIDTALMGCVVTTKNDLVLRDVDLLKRIAAHSPMVVMIPIATFSEAVTKKIEPHAPRPTDRFRLVAKLTAEGIPCGIKMSPMIPFVNDTEDNLREIIRGAKNAGARYIYPAFGITLRNGQRERFYAMIEREFPGLKNVYMDTFGLKTACVSPSAPQLKKIFVIECKKQKILYGMKDIVNMIRPEKTVQLKLF
ncbi:MAG TPA: radical SAM protein [Candidatus Izemoplasmatales bacterium]|nr:radical SAM protein [Candidatus Izemoplasmatales bacterium]